MKFTLGLLALANAFYLISSQNVTIIENDVKKVSILNQDEVETGLFLLVAVCFILLLAVIILLANYIGAKSELKKLQQKNLASVA
ncbi:hypothetical protein LSH36_44g05031 [Paralvinella palmiformis]|uniref:Uncharacterized protein n=1 Tax=Paralvinella palmiformis TaxID=53620 RepID=A0AAD9K8D7_9ANNE|nr:hypothetical protein LSH36_44g05031 [Paralvinella palmiformis]